MSIVKSNIIKGEIQVSKKTLVHVSEGIYRSYGSAIKELVNNAFDANAKTVTITTNAPIFDILTIKDNGNGMPVEEFIRIVKGGIGDSLKRTQQDESNRPTIGKLGIGILAIAQICRSFTIVSHHAKTKTAFKARMIFRTDLDKVAVEKIKREYDVGTYEIIDNSIEYSEKQKGVYLFTDDLRKPYTIQLSKDFRKKQVSINDLPIDFGELLDIFYESYLSPKRIRSILELGPYYELIWELSNLLPLPYYKEHILREEVVENTNLFPDAKIVNNFLIQKQTGLKKFDFSVIIDSIKLYRPIKLPTTLKNYGETQACQIYYFSHDKKVRGRKLKFEGYIFAQEKAIHPIDLKGIQIRIKNVGIGNHDATFLKYEKIESPRDNWVTGEVFVEEGLESALNIDRDSFNENDEHYFILRREIHKNLEKAYSDIKKRATSRSKGRSVSKQEKKNILFKENLTSQIHEYIDKDAIIQYDNTNSSKIEFNTTEHKINIPNSIITSKKDDRVEIFLNSVFDLIEEINNIEEDKEKAKEIFKKISKAILL